MFAIAAVIAACHAQAEEPRSGYDFMEPATRALQDDDFLNPAFFLVEQGLSLWQTPTGLNDLSCASCHGDVATLAGVAARYPEFDPVLGELLNLELRIMH